MNGVHGELPVFYTNKNWDLRDGRRILSGTNKLSTPFLVPLPGKFRLVKSFAKWTGTVLILFKIWLTKGLDVDHDFPFIPVPQSDIDNRLHGFSCVILNK